MTQAGTVAIRRLMSRFFQSLSSWHEGAALQVYAQHQQLLEKFDTFETFKRTKLLERQAFLEKCRQDYRSLIGAHNIPRPPEHGQVDGQLLVGLYLSTWVSGGPKNPILAQMYIALLNYGEKLIGVPQARQDFLERRASISKTLNRKRRRVTVPKPRITEMEDTYDSITPKDGVGGHRDENQLNVDEMVEDAECYFQSNESGWFYDGEDKSDCDGKFC